MQICDFRRYKLNGLDYTEYFNEERQVDEVKITVFYSIWLFFFYWDILPWAAARWIPHGVETLVDAEADEMLNLMIQRRLGSDGEGEGMQNSSTNVLKADTVG